MRWEEKLGKFLEVSTWSSLRGQRYVGTNSFWMYSVETAPMVWDGKHWDFPSSMLWWGPYKICCQASPTPRPLHLNSSWTWVAFLGQTSYKKGHLIPKVRSCWMWMKVEEGGLLGWGSMMLAFLMQWASVHLTPDYVGGGWAWNQFSTLHIWFPRAHLPCEETSTSSALQQRIAMETRGLAGSRGSSFTGHAPAR
jgi:hypothetical protein